MTVNFSVTLVNAPDGKAYFQHPDGNTEPPPDGTLYSVYPISATGIFSNDTIPNASAQYEIISADSPSRWTFFDGGDYIFDAVGATPGAYVATYRVYDYNGAGANTSATITVTVT